MRAVTYDEYGDPDVLHVAEVPEPHAGDGEIRVAVAATAVNPLDWKIRSGQGTAFASPDFPKIPGYDAAGTVDEVGAGVSDVALGDLVYGQGGQGVTAEHAVLYAWAPVPAGLDLVDAAALPMATETAARVLRILALSPGDVIVVDGAAGGVGSALVQLAAADGLEVVGTASEANHDYLRDLGARPTTYGAGLTDRVRDLVDAPVAAGVDLVGKGSIPDLVELTGDPARVVTIADFGAGEQGVHVSGGPDEPKAYDAWTEVNRLVEAGRFTLEVGEVVPWTDAAAAHARSETGHARGKTVIRVG